MIHDETLQKRWTDDWVAQPVEKRTEFQCKVPKVWGCYHSSGMRQSSFWIHQEGQAWDHTLSKKSITTILCHLLLPQRRMISEDTQFQQERISVMYYLSVRWHWWQRKILWGKGNGTLKIPPLTSNCSSRSHFSSSAMQLTSTLLQSNSSCCECRLDVDC